MKQTEGAPHTEPRGQRAAARSEPGDEARSRSQTEARGRTGRNSCSGHAVGSQAGTELESNGDTTPRAGTIDCPVSGLPTDAIPGPAEASESTDAGESTQSATNSEESNAQTATTAATNIFVLPLPSNVVSFPQPTPEAAAASAVALIGNAGSLSPSLVALTPAQESTATRETIVEMLAADAKAASAGDSATALPGVDLRRLGLESLSERERLAVDLRQAIAHLEEGDLGSPASDTADEAADSRIVPFPGPMSAHDNKIIRVQFGSSAPSVGFVAPESADDATGADGDDGASPQLPTDGGLEENSAGLEASPARTASSPEQPGRGAGPAKQAGFAWRSEAATAPLEADGTSTARRERNMDSRLTSAELSPIEGSGEHRDRDDALLAPLPRALEGSGRLAAGDWLAAGETRSATHAAGEVSPEAIRPADAANSVERIAKLVSREAVLFRQHSSDSMAVVLRPDANTELLLHLSIRNGQIEANVRCERGDFQQLNALWGQLQESMGQQKVRLAPLQEAASDPDSFRPSGGSLSQQGRDESGRQPHPNRDFMEEWPAPASSQQSPAHVRSRGEDTRRRHSTSRPGWETWA